MPMDHSKYPKNGIRSKVTVDRPLLEALRQYSKSLGISQNMLVRIALKDYVAAYFPGSPLEKLLFHKLRGKTFRFTYTITQDAHALAKEWSAEHSMPMAQLIRAGLIWQIAPSRCPTWIVAMGGEDIAWFEAKSDAQLFIRHRPNGHLLRLRQGGRHA